MLCVDALRMSGTTASDVPLLLYVHPEIKPLTLPKTITRHLVHFGMPVPRYTNHLLINQIDNIQTNHNKNPFASYMILLA